MRYPDTSRSTLPDLQARRTGRLVMICGAIACGAALCWALVFALQGAWLAMALQGGMVVLCACTAWLADRGRVRLASDLLIAAMYLMVLATALVLDGPVSDVPRSTHQYFVALAVVSSLMLRERAAWLRYAVPTVCMITFVVLACSDVGVASPLRPPLAMRIPGQWVTNALAALIVLVALHVLQTDAAVRTHQERELANALLSGQMVLFYQPQVSQGREVFGAEALVRWRHPVRGLVAPGEFIPLAEKTGLMLPLGDWVLQQACEQLARWQARPETAMLRLSINVSASQMMQADFVHKVQAAVSSTGINPGLLKLELTESVLAHDLKDIEAKMNQLKAQGIGFSLDDFGTGFSSLSYLRNLPLDQLKIDRSFVSHMLRSSNDAAISQAVITLGRSLNLDVIAEGVETREQLQFLEGIGCHLVQGFLFGRPMPVAEFDLMMMRQAARLPLVEMPVRQPQAAEPARQA